MAQDLVLVAGGQGGESGRCGGGQAEGCEGCDYGYEVADGQFRWHWGWGSVGVEIDWCDENAECTV